MYHTLLVRYGEISLKGKNRGKFEDLLINNIRRALKGTPHGKITKTFGRVYIETQDNWEQITKALQTVFGIVSISPVIALPLDLDQIKATALMLAKRSQATTFKVQTRRPNKDFPLDTPQVNNELGGYILSNMPDIRVDVHNPELLINLELRKEGAYIFSEVVPCLGGMPAGSAGKGLLLLSGGIDSPVAGFLSMKRGVNIEGLHFYSYPFTNERSKEKVVELARILSRYNKNVSLKLWVAYFTEIQKALQANPFPSLKITLMRRLMLRIATSLAEREKALALITGESLGQVASQTMESMYTINAVTSMPILRPLVGMDKQEIIDISTKIGTYETSILPHEDCCTIFVPKNPATRPTVEQALEAEDHLDIPGLVEEAIARTELIEVDQKLTLF